MLRFLIAVLVVIVLLAGLYLVVSGRKTTPSQNQTNPQQQSQVPATFAPNDDSDVAIDNDLTALERELSEIDSSTNGFSTEYQGI